MATYYHGAADMQADSLQTLYLMNPSYISYADSTPPTNMILLNSAVNSVSSVNVPQQHFVGVPLETSSHHYSNSLWAQSTNNTSSTPRNEKYEGTMSSRPLSLGRSSAGQQQALSLSLSPHEMGAPTSEAKASIQSLLMGSKYLKAAQGLLDEVVSVGRGIRDETGEKSKKNSKDLDVTTMVEDETGKRAAAELSTAERQELQMKKAKLVNMLDEVEQRYRQYHHQMQVVVSSFEAIAGPRSATTYTALALQTISKQFRCLRDAITGQIRATSKGLGEEDSTKSSGSRLRFVDHHLRQQRALQQLGIIQHNAWRPQRGLPERSVSILRAWLFEHFLHPYPKDSDKVMLAKQTGLTRSQVSNWFINARVRLWKPMVEEMYLEEVKDQEQNNGDENSSKSEGNGSPTTKSSGQQVSSPTTEGLVVENNLKNDHVQAPTTVQASYLTNSYDNDNIMQPLAKRARTNDHPISIEMKPEEPSNQELLLKFIDGRQRVDQGFSILPGSINHGANYGAYTIGELGEQFAPRYSNNGVSLTLGLPHCENLGAPQSFLSSNESMQAALGRRLDISTEGSLEFCGLDNNPTVAHSSAAYESIDIQNRKRFAAQLLPDYVA